MRVLERVRMRNDKGWLSGYLVWGLKERICLISPLLL
jgi:hypothetical protein